MCCSINALIYFLYSLLLSNFTDEKTESQKGQETCLMLPIECIRSLMFPKSIWLKNLQLQWKRLYYPKDWIFKTCCTLHLLTGCPVNPWTTPEMEKMWHPDCIFGLSLTPKVMQRSSVKPKVQVVGIENVGTKIETDYQILEIRGVKQCAQSPSYSGHGVLQCREVIPLNTSL